MGVTRQERVTGEVGEDVPGLGHRWFGVGGNGLTDGSVGWGAGMVAGEGRPPGGEGGA